ncbi:prephenate dehydrogenase [Variovorax ginsengisoli]|uniref:Prephenate dehydrogenase n=1 Tax=Variovorax ginsengisoli TaxID=363844 RepID=A0ABT9S1F3_9BURK|nr:prephenate dehydrogenase/arogenate dehydrogenase family protein [Variovorax ginsengisoli]MDP9898176.1 prephenate dehydrogenase [Variovorax ginsengisoli]
MFEQLGLIGCGLMGGSFALALRRAGLVRQIVGYSHSPASTERARQLGVIDVAAHSAQEAAHGADLVLVAVPVAASLSTFQAIRPALGAGALVMDVGSTKCDVIEAARHGLAERLGNFVPAHPIAGKECAGVDHADPHLYTGRQVILTPLPETRLAQTQRANAVWSALGAHVRSMTPESHDSALAAVSHLPHLLAFAFTNGLTAQANSAHFFELAGPGFRDFSRIAAAEPTLWRDVLLANRTQVQLQLDAFRGALADLEALMQAGDATGLGQAIAAASATRSQWTMGTGPVVDATSASTPA